MICPNCGAFRNHAFPPGLNENIKCDECEEIIHSGLWLDPGGHGIPGLPVPGGIVLDWHSSSENISTQTQKEFKSLNTEDLERVKKLMFPSQDPVPEWMTRQFVGGMLGGIRIILNPSLPDDTMIVSRRLFESLMRDAKPAGGSDEKPKGS